MQKLFEKLFLEELATPNHIEWGGFGFIQDSNSTTGLSLGLVDLAVASRPSQ